MPAILSGNFQPVDCSTNYKILLKKTLLEKRGRFNEVQV
jgi:hypothetical protein